MDLQYRDSIEWVVTISIATRGKHEAIVAVSHHLTLHPCGHLLARRCISNFIQAIQQDQALPPFKMAVDPLCQHNGSTAILKGGSAWSCWMAWMKLLMQRRASRWPHGCSVKWWLTATIASCLPLVAMDIVTTHSILSRYWRSIPSLLTRSSALCRTGIWPMS